MAILDDIVALTGAIEARVEAGDWPGAAALDSERRVRLAELLAASSGQLDRTARRILEDLLARHRSTVSRVEQERCAVGEALQSLAQSPVALRAYARAAGVTIHAGAAVAGPALAGSNPA